MSEAKHTTTGRAINEDGDRYFHCHDFVNSERFHITGIYANDGRTYAQLRKGNTIQHNVDVTDMEFTAIPL